MSHDASRLTTSETPDKLKAVFAALLEASGYAADTDSDLWDFAISIQQLVSLGVSETDLRWLVRKGFAEHGREVTVEGDNGREFRSTGNLTFCRRTCFVLTESGIETAQSQHDPSSNGDTTASGNDGLAECNSESPAPHWDPASRKLQLDGHLVKRFKWPAVNQEAVLCAFQEEGWPERIDDPLPPHPEQDSKRRLADTIKCLNRKQSNELLHFRGDGTGEGVVWERVDDRMTS